MNIIKHNKLVKHEGMIRSIMLTSTIMSNSAVMEGRPLCLKLTPYPRNIIGDRLDIVSPREYRYGDIPAVPIVPTQGVMDKTRKVPTRGIACVTPSESEPAIGQLSKDKLQGRECL